MTYQFKYRHTQIQKRANFKMKHVTTNGSYLSKKKLCISLKKKRTFGLSLKQPTLQADVGQHISYFELLQTLKVIKFAPV